MLLQRELGQQLAVRLDKHIAVRNNYLRQQAQPLRRFRGVQELRGR